MKKILETLFFIGIITFIGWSILTINIEVTDAFNSSEYETQNVDYEKIKEETGLDIERLRKDDSFLKTYEDEKGIVVILGKYIFDLRENIFGNLINECINAIDQLVLNFKNIILNYT